MLLTRCSCGKKFSIEEVERKMIDDKIQEIYFSCPKCRKHYHVAYTDQEIRELGKVMKDEIEKMLKDKGNQALINKVQKLADKHKKLMDKLNKKEIKDG